MNLVVDAGNSFVKLAVFTLEGTIVHSENGTIADFNQAIRGIFAKYQKIKHAIISNVGGLHKNHINIVAVFCAVHELGTTTKVPFKNSYASPQTLGVDRIALATAAFCNFPNRNTLVIDAGTCITYDMVNDAGEYLGGAISPGIAMRYKALHQHTAKLPLLETSEILDFIGNSTENSIHSGVINGVCMEIDGVINQYRSRFLHLTVILTGGDAQFLSKRLKNTIFANSKFLLEGLNFLLEYNKR
ncbi:type III pantothenate kinase [Arenibacter sp. GZD96]|uniref:type III pantothenate kinase n=1 Tax=Aurantibrevibacter litoralis TaxID=3106030 RepID=UPI002AFEE830|nr:type III pantothenate kinase [Arenibacter sp. GZD-96]MEA1785595.1 type III pantothenate kinase [Arenibacter sp. GZD-96]